MTTETANTEEPYWKLLCSVFDRVYPLIPRAQRTRDTHFIYVGYPVSPKERLAGAHPRAGSDLAKALRDSKEGEPVVALINLDNVYQEGEEHHVLKRGDIHIVIATEHGKEGTSLIGPAFRWKRLMAPGGADA